jgi:hypothetical protein
VHIYIKILCAPSQNFWFAVQICTVAFYAGFPSGGHQIRARQIRNEKGTRKTTCTTNTKYHINELQWYIDKWCKLHVAELSEWLFLMNLYCLSCTWVVSRRSEQLMMIWCNWIGHARVKHDVRCLCWWLSLDSWEWQARAEWEHLLPLMQERHLWMPLALTLEVWMPTLHVIGVCDWHAGLRHGAWHSHGPRVHTCWVG